MNNIFRLSPDLLARPLAIAAILVALTLIWQGVRTPHLLRIALRNMPRRKLRTALVVFGLMLATTFVSCAIAIDDTLVQAVKTVAVYNLGRVDEQVVSRGGSLDPFAAAVGDQVRDTLASGSNVAGIAPGLLLPNVLVADETVRQIRGGVAAVAVNDAGAGPLTSFTDAATGDPVSIAVQHEDEIFLNSSAGKLLNASPGDAIYLYSDRWPGKRYAFTVGGIISGGLLGDAPTVLLTMPALSRLMDVSDEINVIYIANIGNGISGIGYSDEIANTIRPSLPGFLAVRTVKADGVELSLRAQDIFGRILTLFTLFAFAIGLLLIFLIFSLLAAERRTELGMVRAIGMRRSHVILMLLFEGATYDTVAALLGVLTGLGLGVLIVALVSPVITQLGYPLRFNIQIQGMIVAFCLGAIFTLATILLAAWNISRMTVAAALRDLPEPPMPRANIISLASEAITRTLHPLDTADHTPTNILIAWGRLLESAITTGIIPFVIGIVLLHSAVDRSDGLLFAAGLSITAIGLVLLARQGTLAFVAHHAKRTTPTSVAERMARATSQADRLAALVLGGGLALYW
ncbi:MAG TPA: ABC transporter permease, partial [Ktedonobacterales bacterium]|nr:ABC transporter permease [Ktedonobacterales bacterium]